MRRLVPLVLVLATVSGVSPLAAQQQLDLEESLKDILDQALRINIVARVLPTQTEAVTHTKLTIPGHAVSVHRSSQTLENHMRPFALHRSSTPSGEVRSHTPRTSGAKAVSHRVWVRKT